MQCITVPMREYFVFQDIGSTVDRKNKFYFRSVNKTYEFAMESPCGVHRFLSAVLA
jgi:hypothetical protein